MYVYIDIYYTYTYVHRHLLILVDDQSIFNPIMNSRIILKMFTQLLKVSSLAVKMAGLVRVDVLFPTEIGEISDIGFRSSSR